MAGRPRASLALYVDRLASTAKPKTPMTSKGNAGSGTVDNVTFGKNDAPVYSPTVKHIGSTSAKKVI
jgi:hypothetical protein